MNGTYTQRRRMQMAGGGITSLRDQIKYNVRPGETLVGKPGGLVEPGVKQYGIVSKIKDKIVDDLIPNEIKESPVGAALVGGALVNQFGIPGIAGDVGETWGQNWLGELLGNVPGVKGGTVDTVLGKGGGGQSIMDIFRPETISKNPVGGLDQLYKDIIKAGEKYDPEEDWKLGDFEKWGKQAQGNLTGTLKDYLTKTLGDTAKQEAAKVLQKTTGTSGTDGTTTG